MKNEINKQIELLKVQIMDGFYNSDKKHLLITGSKGRGKTTILNEILKNINSYGGIRTIVVKDDKIPPKCVLIKDINNPGIEGIIGIRNNDDTGVDPLPHTFEELGTKILKNCIESNVDTIVIDEIGFLENSAFKYHEEVLTVLDKKNCILILRKDKTLLADKILNRDDIYLIDIDNFR